MFMFAGCAADFPFGIGRGIPGELFFKLGSSEKWVGAFGVSDDREKSFGAPEAQISPRLPQI